MKYSTKYLVQAALIAALYATLTLLLSPIGYGPIQFRISEVLTLLPVISSASIPGLFIGCILANWLGGFGLADIIFGSLATLLAAISTYLLRRTRFLYPLPPAIFNGVIVGSYIYLLYDKTYPIALTMLFIGGAEAVICYGFGLPLISFIRKSPGLRRSLHIDE